MHHGATDARSKSVPHLAQRTAHRCIAIKIDEEREDHGDAHGAGESRHLSDARAGCVPSAVATAGVRRGHRASPPGWMRQ